MINSKFVGLDKLTFKSESLLELLDKIYNSSTGKKEDIKALKNNEITELAENLTHGVPFATSVFDGAAESDIQDMLTLKF